MATGDLFNNVKKLQGMLKKVNYEKDSDFKGITQGQSNAYLPIYHYLFVNYSQPFSQKILEMKVELRGKSDSRFVEGMYRVLRDMFNYKPAITKDQFFVSGFIEKKMIMCTDILKLVLEKHQSLVPRHVKVPAPYGRVCSKVGKVFSANSSFESNCSDKTVDKEESIGGIKRPHVVNELRNPKNKYTASKFNASVPTSPIHKSASDRSQSSPILKATEEHMRGDEGGDETQDPIEILALTPGASAKTSGRSRYSPISQIANSSVMQGITERLRAVESQANGLDNIAQQLAACESRMNRYEKSIAHLEDRDAQTPTFTRSQLENLLARLTIVENKVAIMDIQPTQAGNPSVPSPGNVGAKTGLAQGFPSQEPPQSVSLEPNILSPISVTARDNISGAPVSPDMSVDLPNEKETGTRSSTPDDKTKRNLSLSLHFVDTPTTNQAKRILEMIHGTECLMNSNENENDPLLTEC